ncbi:amidohydrolase [Aureivirga marina]|uniref:amidohydrolase n=1 Tax=Aureivirga marina TaxID=1182451 RepID=UPI0018CA59D7|nr:amidohydrolase [Aureivirga marina]
MKKLKQVFSLTVLCMLFLFSSCKSRRSNPDSEMIIADKVLINGKVYTADTENPIVEAIAIKGNKIISVGTTEEVLKLAAEDTEKIDLQNHLVIPGFNDAHFHSFSNAPVGHQIKLPWEPSWEQVLEAVKKAVKEVPEGTWITGLAGVKVIDDEKSDRFSLDKIAPNHPVYISTWFSHGEIINTKAMKLFGLDEKVKDPLGGWFIRKEGSDVITGKFHEYAQWPLRRQLMDFNLNDQQLTEAMKAQTEELLSNGVTSIQDMPILAPDRYLKVLEDSKIPIRVRYIRMPNTTPTGRDTEESKNLPTYPIENKLVKATGTKWFLDGTPMERVAAIRKEYADKPNWKGKMSFTNSEIKEILANPDTEWRGQVLFHTHGDRSAEIIINTMESMKGVDWKSKRVRMEHGDGVVEDLIPRAANLGAIVVQQPHHLVLADIVKSRFGHETHFFKMKSLLNANIPLAFGTEGVEGPFSAFAFALNHPLDSNESLTREEVIDGFTKGSAYAEFEEHHKGQIKKGMLADIAVLSQDILTIPVEKIVETKSIMTIVDGKIVYDTKELNTKNK